MCEIGLISEGRGEGMERKKGRESGRHRHITQTQRDKYMKKTYITLRDTCREDGENDVSPPRVEILVEGAVTHVIARPKDGLPTCCFLLMLGAG